MDNFEIGTTIAATITTLACAFCYAIYKALQLVDTFRNTDTDE